MSDKPECGNAQKMREALQGLISAIDTSDLRDCARTGEWCGNCSYHPLCEAIESAKAALSAPPRNCDIGTAEELPFEAKGYYIVKTGTNYAVAKSNLAGIERQCAEMNKAALEWHKQKLAHECASTRQEEKR